jgi:hypothetical protein
LLSEQWDPIVSPFFFFFFFQLLKKLAEDTHAMALCSAPSVVPLQGNSSTFTARELSLLPRKALKMIAEEEGISTVGNKDDIRERILLGKKKSKTGRKTKTPAVEEVKEASMYQEQLQGASEEKIAEILAKKEDMKKEMIDKSPSSYEFGAGKVI